MKIKRAIKILSALSQETRLAIFKLLIENDEAGINAGKIAEILNVPAATLSFHLSQLADAKLIDAKREGRQILYSARQKTVKKLYQFLMNKEKPLLDIKATDIDLEDEDDTEEKE